MKSWTPAVAAVALGCALCTPASALNLSQTGSGQVLLYPYYTVNGGNQTLVSIVNGERRAKAVRVTFREGRNGRPVYALNLYLAPFDAWTGTVFADGPTGPARLASSDRSCTAPPVSATEPRSFRNFWYTGTNDDWRNGPPSLGMIERTREGHIEVIEMGVLQAGVAATQLAEEVTHGAVDPAPANCETVLAALSAPNGAWYRNPSAGIDLPGGNLHGAATIVDVADGTLYSYSADAIDGFYTNAAQPGFLHHWPGDAEPDLGDADNGNGVIHVNLGELPAQAVPARAKNPTFASPAYSYDAVSLLLMKSSIDNEYSVDGALGAVSEWVVTMPTKTHYVGKDFVPARQPFTNSFTDDGSACERYLRGAAARDGRAFAFDALVEGVPPPTAPSAPGNGTSLCWQVNVLSMDSRSSLSPIFASPYAERAIDAGRAGGIATGTLRIEFGDENEEFAKPYSRSRRNTLDNRLNQSQGIRLAGLPVIGFWAVRYVNAAARPGRLAEYSATYRHRGTRQLAP